MKENNKITAKEARELANSVNEVFADICNEIFEVVKYSAGIGEYNCLITMNGTSELKTKILLYFCSLGFKCHYEKSVGDPIEFLVIRWE